MKRVLWILALSALATGCSRKEDAPPPNNPHVAGSWSGNGTDDAIGYFNLSVDFTQAGNAAAGSFTMASQIGTVSGDIATSFGALNGGNNLQSMTLTRTKWNVGDPAMAARVCAATMTVRPGSTYITSTSVVFGYTMTDCQGGTWLGGANLHKVAGTN